jgi:putative transposase
MRVEYLYDIIFTSLTQARFVLAAWRHYYSQQQPHSSLGNKSPSKWQRWQAVSRAGA